MRTRSDSPTKNCTEDGCSNALRAKGLCGTHYNQQHQPNRHAKVMMPCSTCGEMVPKDVANTRMARFCSMICRLWFSSGVGWSEELQADHSARIYGRTCVWVAPTKPNPHIGKKLTAGRCLDCDAWYVAIDMADQSSYCSERCHSRASKRRRRALENNAPGTFRYAEVIHLYILAGKVCAYCEQPITGLPDPEHVMPLSRGGRNDLTNLVAACRMCNSDKGDLTLTEWAIDRLRRGLEPVRTALDTTSLAFRHLVVSEPIRPAWRHREAA